MATPLPKILIGTSLVVSLCAGGLSFYAYNNLKSAHDEVNAAKQGNAPLIAARDSAQREIKEIKDQMAKVAPAKEAAEAKASAAQEAADKASADLKAANDKLTETQAELVKATAATTPASVPQVAADPEKDKQLKDALAVIEEKKQIEATLTAKTSNLETQIKSLEDANGAHEKALAKTVLEGKVLAVNPTWNFVVLSVGDKQGIAPNSTLLIKRGASMVAKVRVTSVEPATSIADIVPGTAAKHFHVQPGDVVIYGGS